MARLLKLAFATFIASTLAWGQPGYVVATVAGNGKLPFVGHGRPAAAAMLVIPEGIASDGTGGFAFSDSYYDRVFRVDAGGTLTVAAGNGVDDFSGDGGPALDASLSAPTGVAFDRQGRLVVADGGNGRVRLVELDGTIRTIAGGGPAERASGARAVDVRFGFLPGVTIDPDGLVVFADSTNSQVWRIEADGTLRLLAGQQGRRGYAGDGGPAVDALLSGPSHLVYDRDRNLLIADRINHSIRRVTPGGNISTIVGDGQFGSEGDGVPGTQARLGFPGGMAFDASGALLFVEFASGRLRRLGPDGIVTTVTDGVRLPLLRGPTGLAILPDGAVLVVAQISRLILRATGAQPAVVAGLQNNPAPGDGGLAITAHILNPTGVGRDSNGNLFVGDLVDHRIRMVRQADERIATVAGTGAPGLTGNGGPATAASVGRPAGLTVDRANNVFISFLTGSGVRRFTPGGAIAAVAGGAQLGFAGDGGPATDARFNGADGIALDAGGGLYLPDTFNHRLRRVANGVVTTIAGTGIEGYTGDGGPAAAARLSLPNHSAVDGDGNVYFIDSGNRVIRRIAPDGAIRTWFGVANSGIDGDPGPGAFTGLAIDARNNVYISSFSRTQIYRVSGNRATVIAGNRQVGFTGDGGDALRAALSGPTYLWADPDGTVYFTDSGNARVRRLQPVENLPPPVTNAASFLQGDVAPGEIVTFFTAVDSGPAQLLTAALDDQGRIATELAGTRVFFEDMPAPLVYTQARQISVIVPFGVAGRGNVEFRIEFNGAVTQRGRVGVAPTSPGVFTLAGGTGQAAMINQDGTFNTPDSRAPVGSIVAFFVAGGGETTPPGRDGRLAADEIPRPVAPIVVTIGGVEAEVLYGANAPGLVEGLIQINARIGQGVTPGANVPLFVRIGNRQSQAGVTLSVR